jgi:hypothetical protein
MFMALLSVSYYRRQLYITLLVSDGSPLRACASISPGEDSFSCSGEEVVRYPVARAPPIQEPVI